MTKLEEFKSKLQEMFEIDKADLDFGIYRIMNQKRDAINKFMSNLEEDVTKELSALKKSGAEELKKELEEKIKQIQELGYNPDENPKVIELRNRIKGNVDIVTIESEVYSHLTNFFGRYYSEGDFISQRRYKDGVYALPYEGEEVKLHWANHDQYYIKTSENFNNYIVTLDETKKLHFHIVEASTEKNNNKEAEGKERRFFLLEENPVEIVENEVIIKFEYNLSKEKQDKLNIDSANTVLSIIEKENKELFDLLSKEKLNSEGKSYKKKLSRLEYELNNYTSKNSFDYFIHKDLGGFLRRELDFYIKNEVMFLDDLDEEKIKNSISKVRTIKTIGHKIIQMLEQIENFQKKLWEKKKFVVETNYCFTLDKIFEKFEEEEQKDIIDEVLSNVDQLDEWKEMYDFDIEEELKNINKQDGLFKNEYSDFELLKQNDKLVIDTKYFSIDFKEKIISAFEKLEEELNGTLIHSENFQALGLLQEKYKEKIKCVYIDPPYNTTENAFVYKNMYKHSSWISMMFDRVEMSKNIISNNGICSVAIDDTESSILKIILDNIFDYKNYVSTIAVEVNPAGQNLKPNSPACSHDYFHTYAKNIELMEMFLRGLTTEETKMYKESDEKGKFLWDNLRRRGGNSRPSDRPKQWFPLYVNLEKKIVDVEKFDDSIEVWPIDPKGENRIWRNNYDGVKRDVLLGEISVTEKNGRIEVIKKTRIPEGKKPKTMWYESIYSATSYGTKLLLDILGNQIFSYPKSINLVKDALRFWVTNNDYVIDFFSGSGTTGHAVVDLNREDDGNRKYILVEMGEYFDSATKPRIKKIIYSKDWKNGKPLSRNGISQIFKYIKLEQYEDTLNNLTIKKVQQTTLSDGSFENEYMLNYMMEFETKDSPSLLNIDMFKNPFEYKMKIIEKDEIKNKNIDLVETFNYLLGIDILSNTTKRNFTFIDGKIKEDKQGTFAIKEIIGVDREGNKNLIIWRSISSDLVTDNKFLEEYFRKMRISTLDMEYDYIYINGDNTLQNIRKDSENWKVILTEEKFKKLMFDEKVL